MIADHEAEAAIIGAIVVSSAFLERFYGQVGLRPEHFHDQRAARLYRASLDLAMEGTPVDTITLGAAVSCPPAEVDAWAAHARDVEATRAYGHRIVELARWRTRHQAGQMIAEAAQAQDGAKLAEGEALLMPADSDERTFSPERLKDLALSQLEESTPETFSLGFPNLNEACAAGGLRRAEVALLGGWSSHGKSVLLDQILEYAVRAGRRAHLYINEMTAAGRLERALARRTGIPLKRIARRRLDVDEKQRVMRAMADLPFGITDAAGWTAEGIVRHVRWNRWDIVGIDILHLIDHQEERDVAAISRTINQAAKACNCAVVATVHLNEARVTAQKRPRPTVGDIRGSGMLKNDADVVMFVHRDQDDDGSLCDEGSIYIAKHRHGTEVAVRIILNGRRMRFEEPQYGGSVSSSPNPTTTEAMPF